MDKATTSSIDTIARTCIAVRLRLLNRVVTNLYDDALRPLGLKVSQLNILIVTAKLGLARPAQVCDILQLDASTLSRNVKPLQAHGWLEVVPEEDARAQPFRLTPQGKRLIEKAVPALCCWRRVLHNCHHRTQVQTWLRLAGHEPVPAIYGPSGDVKWDEADPTYSPEAAKRGG